MAMKSLSILAVLSLLALTLPLVISSDPSPVQDFCVGVNTPANGGFVSSNGDGNRLFTKTLSKGDAFVFPEGLIHFQFNVGRSPAVAFAALSSQNPGVVTIANTVFGSNPPINPNVLSRAFQLDPRVVMDLQNKF
ncbi:unnamed protein product [Eruca vesicaria subsp. sativa]|uniref:Germin-like protein n=1 Tax=Eruca vesicaria subsp. sativa TaxID=29727 RepID=A0ABC8KTH7_ERUVS|nr:unnamed protein product [Eruca vesicaria subsp. sativa]